MTDIRLTDRLRKTAIAHASQPYVPGQPRPLDVLIPLDVRPTPDLFAAAAAIIGKEVDTTGLGPATAAYVYAARLRVALNRWGMSQPGVMAARTAARRDSSASSDA